MPGQFLPRKSGVHRIACIALYRALLLQCPRINLPADLPSQGVINPIKHFIRKQFRRHVAVTSPRIIVASLKAGYAAEELLRTAGDGNEGSTSQIHTLLWQQHNERQAARAVCLRPTPRPSKPRVWAYPDAPKLMEVRPIPVEKLTGRRAVPVLGLANGVPFLRFKKPQSPFLGRVLRDKMDQKQKRYANAEEMEEMFDLAMHETKFQRLVRNEVQNEAKSIGGERGGKMLEWLDGEGQLWWEDWTRDIWEVKNEAFKRTIDEQKRWVERAERAEGIVEGERELWLKERKERREERWRITLEKKEESGAKNKS